MYKIPASTLFLGKNLVYVPQCHSTNALAAELDQKAETPEGTIVITDNQTSGRGQRGNSWEAQPGKNLTFSLILKPRFLAVKDQFQLNQVVSLGITDYLATVVEKKARIKWPNDIIVQERKVCGILIENHLKADGIHHSIVGIGLNINQQVFESPSAISLNLLTKEEFQLDHELALLLSMLEARYLQLKRGMHRELENHYLHLLYRKDEIHRFNAQGSEFEGIITGVDDAGKIRINVGGVERIFGAKEVAFSE